MSTFLFLEIMDRDINYLLNGIHSAIFKESLKAAPHLTIRGPYRNKVPEDTFEQCRAELTGAVLEISDVGYFSNGSEEVVYFSVKNPGLRRVWWKPDFPISEYGFHPHLSVYRGTDRGLATKVRKFLEREDLKLFCIEFRLVTYVSRQLPLFSEVLKVPRSLIASGRVEASFLNRLSLVVDRHNRKKIRLA